MSNHLKEMNEGYFEHMFYALRYGLKMILGGIALIIHSIIPDIFVTTGSRTMRSIIMEVDQRKEKVSD